MTAPDLDGHVPCPECSALNLPEAKFCADCGCVLTAAVKAAKPPRGRRQARADAIEKSRARQEFGRIKSIVLTVRLVYWTSSVLAAIHILMWHSVLAGMVEYAYGDWYLPVTVLVYAQFALMVAGVVFVLRSPLVWTVVGACNWTLNTVLQWWFVASCIAINDLIDAYQVNLEKIELGVMLVFVGFWTLLLIAFWFAVAQAARVQRLLAENPELSIVRQRFDPARRVEGGVAEQVRTRRRQETGAIWQGRLKLGGMAAGLLVAVGIGIWLLTRPPTVDASIAKFESGFGRSDVAAVGELFAAGSDGSAGRQWREQLQRRGWLEALPQLGAAELEQRGDRAVVRYPCAGGVVEARFTRASNAWSLASLELPPIEPGDLQPALDAFRAAWNAEGIEALVELFRPETRDGHRRSLQSIFERRGWDRQRPQLGDVDPGRVSAGRARALFALGFDEVAVTFDYWHPQYYVVALRPPSR